MNQIQAPFAEIAPSAFAETLANAEPGSTLRAIISGPDFDTFEMKNVTVPLIVPDLEGGDARLNALGVILVPNGDVQQLDEPGFGTELADKLSSFDFYGDEPVAITNVQAASDQLPKELIWFPALLLLALIGFLQNRRFVPPATQGETA